MPRGGHPDGAWTESDFGCHPRDDLAMICGVPTKRLNEQVRRNAKRFPEDFVFRFTEQEVANYDFKLFPAF